MSQLHRHLCGLCFLQKYLVGVIVFQVAWCLCFSVSLKEWGDCVSVQVPSNTSAFVYGLMKCLVQTVTGVQPRGLIVLSWKNNLNLASAVSDLLKCVFADGGLCTHALKHLLGIMHQEYICLFHTCRTSLAHSLWAPLYDAMVLCWQLREHGLAQSASIGALAATLQQNVLNYFCSDDESARVVYFHFCHCVSSAGRFCLPCSSPTIRGRRWLSLEKREQEGSHPLDVWAKELWFVLACGAVALQIGQGCGTRCCSMLYWLLSLLWSAHPSCCTSFMPFNGLIVVINETDVLHSVMETEGWHFNPNICFMQC